LRNCGKLSIQGTCSSLQHWGGEEGEERGGTLYSGSTSAAPRCFAEKSERKNRGGEEKTDPYFGKETRTLTIGTLEWKGGDKQTK